MSGDVGTCTLLKSEVIFLLISVHLFVTLLVLSIDLLLSLAYLVAFVFPALEKDVVT